MTIVYILLIGLVVGVIAKLILPGQNGPGGIIGTALCGIAGSFVGSFLGQFVGFYRAGETAGFIGSVAGAVVVLALWDRFIKRRKA
jgi:uncharacterized membrane protein YeaQ/YmgE (transglycosylase-associated protein family)